MKKAEEEEVKEVQVSEASEIYAKRRYSSMSANLQADFHARRSRECKWRQDYHRNKP